MSNISQFLQSTAIARPMAQRAPGSNGFWRRDIFRLPGTYVWTASKAGKIKIQAIGAGSGGNLGTPGASGCFGEKELTVAVGDTLTIVVGAGSAGTNADTGFSANAGSTSISGTPVGGTPLVLPGAGGVRHSSFGVGAVATATGPWGFATTGAVPTGASQGSPSSGSPFGNGFASTNGGGAGWGGGAADSSGASSHRAAYGNAGVRGLLADGGSYAEGARDGSSQDLWDLRDADGGGGAAGGTVNGGIGGIGAGGGQAGTSSKGGASVLGGGCGVSAASPPPKAGAGAGGGASSAGAGGAGGDAIVFVFWDEVI